MAKNISLNKLGTIFFMNILFGTNLLASYHGLYYGDRGPQFNNSRPDPLKNSLDISNFEENTQEVISNGQVQADINKLGLSFKTLDDLNEKYVLAQNELFLSYHKRLKIVALEKKIARFYQAVAKLIEGGENNLNFLKKIQATEVGLNADDIEALADGLTDEQKEKGLFLLEHKVPFQWNVLRGISSIGLQVIEPFVKEWELLAPNKKQNHDNSAILGQFWNRSAWGSSNDVSCFSAQNEIYDCVQGLPEEFTFIHNEYQVQWILKMIEAYPIDQWNFKDIQNVNSYSYETLAFSLENTVHENQIKLEDIIDIDTAEKYETMKWLVEEVGITLNDAIEKYAYEIKNPHQLEALKYLRELALGKNDQNGNQKFSKLIVSKNLWNPEKGILTIDNEFQIEMLKKIYIKTGKLAGGFLAIKDINNKYSVKAYEILCRHEDQYEFDFKDLRFFDTKESIYALEYHLSHNGEKTVWKNFNVINNEMKLKEYKQIFEQTSGKIKDFHFDNILSHLNELNYPTYSLIDGILPDWKCSFAGNQVLWDVLFSLRYPIQLVLLENILMNSKNIEQSKMIKFFQLLETIGSRDHREDVQIGLFNYLWENQRVLNKKIFTLIRNEYQLEMFKIINELDDKEYPNKDNIFTDFLMRVAFVKSEFQVDALKYMIEKNEEIKFFHYLTIKDEDDYIRFISMSSEDRETLEQYIPVEKYAGLPNFKDGKSNVCFMNAAHKLIARIPGVEKLTSSKEHRLVRHENKRTAKLEDMKSYKARVNFQEVFGLFIHDLKNGNEDTISYLSSEVIFQAKNVLQATRNRTQLDPGNDLGVDQHDAGELLLFELDILDYMNWTTPIKTVQIVMEKDQKPSLTFQEKSIWPIGVRNENKKSYENIQAAYDDSIKWEEIDTGKEHKIYKRVAWTSAPQFVFVQLNRFTYDEQTFDPIKLTNPLKVEDIVVDISNEKGVIKGRAVYYPVGIVLHQSSSFSMPSSYRSSYMDFNWLNSFSSTRSVPEKPKREVEKFTGTAKSGHYVTLLRDDKNSSWTEHNDSSVRTKTDEQAVKNSKSQAYITLYLLDHYEDVSNDSEKDDPTYEEIEASF